MRVNDLIPLSSGLAALGVDMSAGGAFDITTIAPFNRFHVVSGIFHDDLNGQSGVLRYVGNTRFEASVDGGRTFNTILTGANAVSSIGVINGANLTGDVDLAPTTSGFINITDNGSATPISFSLDVWGLSGLYTFPSTGFSNVGRMAARTFSTALIWTFTHNLNASNIIAQAYDNSGNQLIPDDIITTSANVTTFRFNPSQAGKAVVIGF